MRKSGGLRRLDILKDDRNGTVVKAWSDQLQRDVIIKKVPLSARAEIECRLLGDLDHEAIPKLIESYTERDMMCIVMECMPGETLGWAAMHRNFTEQEVIRIISQLAGILSYLHMVKRVVHRDLKPDNVLIDDSGQIYLIDFGYADYASENMRERLGSPAYCSPELVIGQPHSIATDIWSLGVLTYQLLVGKFPFSGENVEEVFRSIYYDHVPMVPLQEYSPECSSFINAVLQKDPKHRLTINEVLQNPWIQKYGRYKAGKNQLAKAEMDGALKKTKGNQRSLPIIRPKVTNVRLTFGNLFK